MVMLPPVVTLTSVFVVCWCCGSRSVVSGLGDRSCGDMPRYKQIAGGHSVESAARWPWHVIVKMKIRDDAAAAEVEPVLDNMYEGGTSGSGSGEETPPERESVRRRKVRVITCSGTLVSMKYVITAGHCITLSNHNLTAEDVTVIAGTNKRLYALDAEDGESWESVQTGEVSRAYVHREYLREDTDGDSRPWSKQYDMAILALDTPLQRSSYVRPICLPRYQSTLDHGAQCITAGMGRTSDDPDASSSSQLYETSAIIDRHLRRECHQDVICLNPDPAQGGGKFCKGDSGGPLMCKSVGSGDQWVLYGVASGAFRAHQCSYNPNGVFFIRTSRFLPRINLHQWRRITIGGGM